MPIFIYVEQALKFKFVYLTSITPEYTYPFSGDPEKKTYHELIKTLEWFSAFLNYDVKIFPPRPNNTVPLISFFR